MKSERDEALKEVCRGLGGLERRDLADGRERGGGGGIPRKGSNPSKDERKKHAAPWDNAEASLPERVQSRG